MEGNIYARRPEPSHAMGATFKCFMGDMPSDAQFSISGYKGPTLGQGVKKKKIK